jgi:frataxin-like iron-binding protein CyaY
MIPLLDIVSDNNFKFSSNADTVTETIKEIVEAQTGVLIKTYRDCPISLIGKIVSTKFGKKQYSKIKFIKKEQIWLSTKHIKVYTSKTPCVTASLCHFFLKH